MNSNRNDWNDAYPAAGREEGFSDPEQGYSGGYGTSRGESYRHGEGRRIADYERDSRRSSSPGNRYGTRGGEYSDYGPGYSTANDFSAQEPARGRLDPQAGRAYRGYNQEDYPRYREMYKRSEYPDTYRSAMSGYMSEHVGYDSGRRDYNQHPGSGNLYGNRHRFHQENRPVDYQQWGERGFMSEDDYDRGSPFYRENTVYGRYGSEQREEGRHKGKGPRNYRRADNRIEEDIIDRLTDDSWIDASDVHVQVQNGEVTLGGMVDDREAKRRAEDIVESVSGVTHVENRMRLRSRSSLDHDIVVTPY